MLTGPLIAGYRVEDLAGNGGMGVVYRATQLALGRPVALKLISPAFADDPQFRERFKRESRLAASIDHPNVIPVYEAGETDGSLFISMRWVEGTDLATLIRRGGGLEPGRAAAIVAQVAAALDAAHARGLLHRDVKPANVLVAAGQGEHVYLTDFGLVKRMSASEELTGSGQLLGTVDYIAPEQIRREGTDARSDVYSLGCVLFHCLTGRVPFEAEDDVAKIYAHLNETPPRPSELVAGMPPALDAVVERAMAKARDDRFASAGELGRAALVGSAGPSERAQRSTIPEAQVLRPAGRGRAVAKRRVKALLALAATGVAGLLLAGVLGDAEQPRPRPGSSQAVAPADGTFLESARTGQLHVVKAGARFALGARERAAFGYEPDEARQVSAAALRSIPTVPRDGSLVRAHSGTVVWVVRDGTRRVITPPVGADVVVIPSSGLGQIPLPRGGRQTSVEVAAPSFVTEGRRFVLSAQVRSLKGVPRGRCVVYRVGRARLKERANNPTRGGRCEARLKVGGFDRVRYSVHFVGYRGWRGSTAATPAIPVVR
jgi:hypothetical protein